MKFFKKYNKNKKGDFFDTQYIYTFSFVWNYIC